MKTRQNAPRRYWRHARNPVLTGAASGQPGGKAVAMPLPSQIPVGATKATVATPAASAAPAKPAAPAGQPKP